MLVRRAQKQWLFVGVALLAVSLVGCQSTQRDSTVQPTTAPAAGEPRMEESIAGSDAERAKAALERDWPAGERRPAVPKRRPVVDQPRPSRR